MVEYMKKTLLPILHGDNSDFEEPWINNNAT